MELLVLQGPGVSSLISSESPSNGFEFEEDPLLEYTLAEGEQALYKLTQNHSYEFRLGGLCFAYRQRTD